MIIKSDYRIPSVREGYGIQLRNKHLNDEDHRLPDNPVLFVHGATYGASGTFDYAVDGESWMDRMAGEGFDAWCLDLLGYGESDRPEEMAEAAENNEPIVDTAHAVREVDRAMDFILKDRGLERISLIGYSWGSAICGRYAGEHADKVDRLVLCGPLWVEKSENAMRSGPALGAYRTVNVESMMKRWSTGLDASEIDAIVGSDVRQKWCEDVVRCDPEFESTGVMRAPTGVFKDYEHCATTGEPWYEPERINSSVLVVVADQDAETTVSQGQKIFSRLVNAAEKRMTVIGGGTHSLFMENNRRALFDVVSGFLRY